MRASPLPVRKSDSESEADVYVLSMVYDAQAAAHVLHIWDGANVQHQALCKLRMPSPLPYGFHTNWMSANDKFGAALPF